MQTCNVSCCGLMNYQQHCNSKRHLRKTAAAAAAVVSEAASPNTGDEDDGSPSLNPTYVGLQAQCRNYCKQVVFLPWISRFPAPFLLTCSCPRRSLGHAMRQNVLGRD